MLFAIWLALLLDCRTALAAECRFILTPAGTFSAGVAPQSLAVGDFNGDGKRDLVVANQFSANVSVLLGNGNGTFQSAVNYFAEQGPVAVAVADLDGDNHPDLAVANSSSESVSVLLGNGNGTFQPNNNYLSGTGPSSVAIRDLDGDTIPDLAVANRASGDVSVLFGNGDGTFQDAAIYPVGVDPLSVAAADFNSDSRSDLAVANAALFAPPSSLSVLLGTTPNGNFQDPADYAVGISPRSVVVGDFNGDGKPDLAAANYGQIAGSSTTNSSVPVLLGRGNGTFSNAVHYLAAAGPASVAVGDFDTNAILDLVVANEKSASISLLFGNGNGTFQPPTDFDAGQHPRSVGVSDFNGDGKPDVAVVNDSGVLVLLNSCQVGGDLALTMTDSPDPVTLGSNLIYTLTVTNRGPDTSYDVSLTNRLPLGLSFVSAISSHGNCAYSNGTINCALGQMTYGDQANITVTVIPTAAGSITSTARVFSVTTTDLFPGNNTATALTTVRPIISLASTDPSATETGPDPGYFTVSRSGGTAGSLVVNYTIAGTALNGADYAPLSGSATIPNGFTSTIITVTPLEDPAVENTETVILTLASNASYTISPPANNATVNILDDDVYNLAINDVSLNEGNAGLTYATFTVSLSWSNPQPVTVSYATSNGDATSPPDYITTNGIVTFAPGVTNQTLRVAVLGDALHEANETFFINLTNPAHALIADSQGVGIILDDDPLPTLTLNDVTLAEGTGGSTVAQFTVRLSAPYPESVTVDYATANSTALAGADYMATNGSLTFAPGLTNQTVAVTILGDALDEANETFFVNLTQPTNALITDSQGVGTIQDDDAAPALTINDNSVVEGSAGTTNMIFTVSLSAASGQTVTMNYATANGAASSASDYVATNGVLSFAPGTTIQTLAVAVRGDTNVEPSETFFVNLSSAVNATLADSQGVGTIVSDDAALSISDVTLAEGNSGTTNAVFTVSLSTVLAQTVTVNYATANGTALATADYVATNGLLSFAPGTINQTIALTVLGDALDEADETLLVNLTNPTNALIADSQGVGTIQDDDPLPALTIDNVTVVEGTGGTTQAVFRVVLSTVSGRSVTVNFTTINGTAAAGNDYVATNGVVNFAPGTTNQIIAVEILGDLLNETDETFLVNLSQPTNASLTVGQGVGVINNDDPLPALAIGGVTVVESTGGTTNALFSVGLSAVSGQSVTVAYATANNTALTGADYVATNGVMAFPPGSTNQTIAVRVVGDPFNEADESFFVNLSNPTNAVIADGQAAGTINDDDLPPALSINDVTVTEGNAGTVQAVFSLSLSAASGLLITVSYATADDSAVASNDYLATNGQVNFAPGSTNQSISVAVSGDTDFEAIEAFFVALSNPQNATLARSQGVGTIINDDGVPGISITDSLVVEGHTGSTQAVFTVELSAPFDELVTVQFATANGTALAGADYVATNGVLSFAPGITNQTIAVTVLGDVLNEADESFLVHLSNPTNAFLANGPGLGTILDDDPLPGLSINDVTLLEGNVGTTQAVFRVALSAVSGQTVSVHYTTADGTANAGNAGQALADYVATNGTVTFAPGITQQTIAVVILGDLVNEANETFSINLSNPANATILDGQGQGTINNNDPLPSFTISDVTVNEGNAGATQAVFTVSLSNPSDRTLTVNFATANGSATAGSDYLATNGIVSIPPGDTNRAIAVVVFADPLNEANDTFFVNLSNPTNAVIGDNQGVGTISDDDPLPELTISDATLTEGNSGNTQALFVLTLSTPSGRPLTVTFATANDTASSTTDYVATNGVLTIAPGTTNRTIAVAVLGDLLNEVDETFLFNLANPTNVILGDSLAVGTILNDDPLPGLSINDLSLAEGTVGTTNAVFTVALSAASGRSVTVSYATADGTATLADYVTTNGLLSFPPGTMTRTFAIPINSDTLSELDETFLVNLSAAGNATINDGQAVATIINSRPAASIAGVVLREGSTGTTNAMFTVQLSSAYDQLVTINFATANNTALAGSDYAPTNGVLSFVPGITNQTIVVTVLSDLLNEADETFRVNLSSPTNAIIASSQGVGAIINDDPLPSLTIHDAAAFEGNSGTANAVFSVSLSAVSGRSVTVNYSTANDGTVGNDLINTSGTLSFDPGQTNRFINVPIRGDTSVETNETFFVNLSSPGNATLARNQAVGTILNDDGVPSLTITDITVVEGNTGTTNAVFTVRLSAAFAQLVTVNYATADVSAKAGADYFPTNGIVTFASGITNQTIAIRVIGDRVSETNKTFLVNLSGSINALISKGTGIGTIVDDDPFNLLLSTNGITVVEGGTGSFGVRLISVPGSNVTVTVARTSGSTNLLVTAGASLTFTPTNWNVFQPVLIQAGGDPDLHNDTALFAVSNSGTIQLVTATALDDGLSESRIVALELVGSNVIIRFKTAANQLYQVERTDSLNPGSISWATVGNPVPGTGGVVSVVDSGGAGRPSRFYRLRLLPPVPEELRIVALEFAGSAVVIKFTTVANHLYRVERTDRLGLNPWSVVGSTVVGTGAEMSVTDVSGAGQPSRFYRAVLLTP